MSVPQIVRNATKLTLLGASTARLTDLEAACAEAPILVCCDGGVDQALAAGLTPDFALGDLDSISPQGRAALAADRLLHLTGQDDTDLDKALAHCPAGLILAVGFQGGRLDHQLAVLSSLLRHADRAIVLLDAVDIALLLPPRLTLDLAAGTRLSLYPMRRCTVTGTGLEWPVQALDLAPDGRIGTSNRALGGAVELSADQPGAILIVARTAFDQVMAALRRQPDFWPARPTE